MRDFLVTRRARITPDQAGLPVYGGSRRVAGLRREEVAFLAGVSIGYYTRLERGRAHCASESVPEGIARALQLGGPAPARRYIPELLGDVLDGTIGPGRVFDYETDLDHIADAYRAMDERRAVKSLVRIGAL
jgi:transcriptional regulator with XRE-family HTH domain